ncbi:MAG: replication-associated recombination protein A, partial [Desulfobacterales bacterium]|nr:replication-associated recombination protein A [Desulfobacterales bacterium]
SDEIAAILDRALQDSKNGLGDLGLIFNQDALSHIIRISDGDARMALSSLEIAASLIVTESNAIKKEIKKYITIEDVERAVQKKALIYDKSGEEHFNIISALHKSMRGSDPDAALYWLGRMLSAGEDPLYIARRLVRFASEDVGNADPGALRVTIDAMEAFRFLGRPEGELALAQAAVYLATAPKSNSIYAAYKNVKNAVKKKGALPVPLHIRNAPTQLMKNLGYGKGYKYAHNYKGAYTTQEYLPEKLKGSRFYVPSERGYEKKIKERLENWRQRKKT